MAACNAPPGAAVEVGMSPNPTARPFIVGALFFMVLIGFWPRGVRAPQVATSVPEPTVATRTAGDTVAVSAVALREAHARR